MEINLLFINSQLHRKSTMQPSYKKQLSWITNCKISHWHTHTHTYLNSHRQQDRIHKASSRSAMPQNNYSHGTRSEDGLAVWLCHARGMSLCSCGNQSVNCSIKQNGVTTNDNIQDTFNGAISHFYHTPVFGHVPPGWGGSLPWHRCCGKIHFPL